MEWTLQDSDEATKQGWNVFYCCGDIWQIQKIDDMSTFKDDTRAWEFVYKQFLVGDKLATKALQYLSEKCREEFLLVKKHCEETVTKNGLYNPV